jgi:hypothetical protein
MREQRKQHSRVHEVGAIKGRRHREAAPNSLKFMARVEGENVDGHIRGANGMRWRLA